MPNLFMTKLFSLLFFLILLQSNLSYADNYNFYFPQSSEDSNSDGIPDSNAMNVKIINTSTYTVYDGNLTDYYGLSYTDLVSTLNSNISGAAYQATLDYIGSGKEVLDFVDSTLTIRENSVIPRNSYHPGRQGYYNPYYQLLSLTFPSMISSESL